MSKIELIGYLNKQGQLEFTFELPAGFPPGEVRIVVAPTDTDTDQSHEAGSAKGQISMRDDFDEPLDDFQQYTD
ncbi:MAG TPA: DUF2281 domain-containing protein [Aggregatilineales bacterium]|nr:DUF2281 domain-containing protein [Aggregatilineales bacterium]